MSKINNKLATINKTALVSYVVAGDPDLQTSYKICETLIKTGTDIIELGMPFSDPVADGATIQNAANRALKQNINLENCFSLAKKLGEKYSETPIILMGYLNPILHYGVSKFIKAAEQHNISGLIIVDLPLEELENYPELRNSRKLPVIPLVTPLTSMSRLQKMSDSMAAFIYFISVFGITGSKTPDLKKVERELNYIKKHIKKKIAVGFGINNAEQIKSLRKFSDLVVIGSAYCKIIEAHLSEPKIMLEQLASFNQQISSNL